MTRAEALRSLDPLDAIAQYVCSDTLGALPENVVRQTKRLLLDGIGWMVMGARKEEARHLLDVAASVAEAGDCGIVGTGQRTASLLDALFVNTALAQVHDCNDGRRLARRDGGSNHPGRCVIPVALTLGQHFRLSGSELLELLVTGYEVVSRVQVRYPDMEYSFAVAALMGKAMGLGPESIRRALALAPLTFPLPADCEMDDSDFDFLRQGFIARAAASATLYAHAAVALPSQSHDVRLASPFPDPQDGNSAGYEILNVYVKPYPCCRALHGAIDLALELRRLGQLDVADIEEIEIRVGNTKAFLFEPVTPAASYKRCEFSIPYVTACALLDGDLGEQSFERRRITAEDVQLLQKRIRCVQDARLEFNPVGKASHFRPTILTVTTREGSRHSRVTMAAKGSPINPLTDDELLAKFREWTGPSLSASRKEEVIGLVGDLESVVDVSQLMLLL